jgi:hypothetical protein
MKKLINILNIKIKIKIILGNVGIVKLGVRERLEQNDCPLFLVPLNSGSLSFSFHVTILFFQFLMDNKGKGAKSLATSLQNLNLNPKSNFKSNSTITTITHPQFPGNSFNPFSIV